MSKRMLIDASHPEETRVVVLDGNKVEEFDFEAASKRPLKGNIYLAKVTRVEPSLQAAFVEYGGNRQGFLAFSEIHPDYYQIPVADRMALLADQSRRLMAEEEEFDNVVTARAPAHESSAVAEETEEAPADTSAENGDASFAASSSDDNGETDAVESDGSDPTPAETGEEPSDAADEAEEREAETEAAAGVRAEAMSEPEPAPAEPAVAAQAESTGAPAPYQRREFRPRPPRRRQYKIQEVIKRRQVILVQVVKEERGNKGASLTTYLSLAGRYCVLMPNTPRGGGISRKITSATDRRRLKSAAQSLELPEGMGLIIRTAGANRTKAEIKRDYEYLLRLWDSVRELTLKSNAPALVYEEGNLIKRSIRDLYNKDISEIVVDGEHGYRDAKEFMRMLMPSHAKNVKPYKEKLPLFQSYHVESQLDAMFSPTVTLRSGGYVVINQTEALVAIDVNSGKATREHSIEDTAYKTNLEAADEIGRQLRLRDLAGLIVIDFIDMEDQKNDRNVEKRLRDAVRGDRARVQIGKISQFGLLEMSRQRLRAGVIAGSTVTCPHCAGIGLVRSTESAALRLLRALDEEGQRQRAANLTVKAPGEVVIYALNQKRREMTRIEDAYDLAIQFEPQVGMPAGSFEIVKTGVRAITAPVKPAAAVSYEAGFHSETETEEETDVTLAEAPSTALSEDISEPIEAEAPSASFARSGGSAGGGQENGQENGKRRRRRRRRGGRGRGPEHGAPPYQQQQQRPQQPHQDLHAEPRAQAEQEEASGDAPMPPSQPAQNASSEEGGRRRRRRRGRRGRRYEGDTNGTPRDSMNGPDSIAASGERHAAPTAETTPDLPGSVSSEREPPIDLPALGVAPNAPSSPQWSLHHEPRQSDVTASRAASASAEPPRPPAREEPAEERPPARTPPAAEAEPPGEARKGWWQRRFKV